MRDQSTEPLCEDDGLRMGEIARRARLSKQTMTTLVRLAERDGLVERRPDEADRRATLVHLSDRGHRFRPAAEQALEDLEKLAVSALGPRAMAATGRGLARLADLDRSPGSSGG